MPCPIKVDNHGIWCVKTWHGTPDSRVRGIDVVSRKRVNL